MSARDPRPRGCWLRPLALVATCAALWVGLAWSGVPTLIRLAYDDATGIPLLDRIITGQHTHPVSHYLDRWRGVAWSGLWIILALGTGPVLLGHPTVRRRIEARAAGAPPRPPRGLRGVAVHGLILGILAGALVDIVTFDEHWPFSRYAMYSTIPSATTFERLQIYGVPARPGAPELRLDADPYLRPFDQSRLHEALQRIVERRDTADVQAALTALARRYERERPRHGGPALAAVRLYRTTWQVDPRARNVAAPRRRVQLATTEPGGPP